MTNIWEKTWNYYLKNELKIWQDDVKKLQMMSWKKSWKNDIGLAQPPLVKCHFWLYIN